MDLIPVPPWSEALMADFFNRTITESLQYGLTSIHDADTSPARIAFFRKYVWLPSPLPKNLTWVVQIG